jgi:hypothetical protein
MMRNGRIQFACAVLLFLQAAVLAANKNTSSFISFGEDTNGLGAIKPACSDGYCTIGFPVCCDGGFCVSGGDKCCPSTTDPQNDMSCDQDELCCPGDVPACCPQGQFCGGNGQCISDLCSAKTDAYSCTQQGHCGWCCSDHRCVDVSAGAPSCTTGPSIVGEGSRCDACYLADTCGQCGQLEGCSWCCNRQQCIPNDDPNMCNVYQRINMTGNLSEALSLCSRCLGLGEGLRLVDIEPQSYESIFGIVGGLCIVIGTAILARYLLMRRMQVAMTRDLSHAEVHEVHENVKRYGFRHPVRPTTSGDGDTQQPQTSDQDGEPLVDDVIVGDQCNRCAAIFVPVPQGRWEGAVTTDATGRKENYVLFLPCGHGACMSCLGMSEATVNRFGTATEAPLPPQQNQDEGDNDPVATDITPATQEMDHDSDDGGEADDSTVVVDGESGAVVPPPQLTPKAAEFLLLRHIHKKCPKCAVAVADVLQVRRLIANAPTSSITPSVPVPPS